MAKASFCAGSLKGSFCKCDADWLKGCAGGVLKGSPPVLEGALLGCVAKGSGLKGSAGRWWNVLFGAGANGCWVNDEGPMAGGLFATLKGGFAEGVPKG